MDSREVPQGRKRLDELDSLRGIAATHVMLSHYLDGYTAYTGDAGSIRYKLPIPAQFSVHLFFIISGFVIYMTVIRCSSWRDFAHSRFVRLFPTYWTCVAVTLASAMLLFPMDVAPKRDVASTVANFSMVQAYFEVVNVDAVYWSLGVELAFYFWVACLILVLKVKAFSYIAWPWLSVCLVAFFFQDYSQGHPIPAGTSFRYAADSALLLRFAPLFISGITFFQMHHGDKSFERHALVLCSLAVYLIVCVYPGLLLGWRTVSAALMIYLVFYLMAYDRLRFIAIPPLVFLGSISYALYLTHNVAGHHFRYWLRMQLQMSDIIALPATILWAILVASLITYCIERPVIGRLRAWRAQGTHALLASRE